MVSMKILSVVLFVSCSVTVTGMKTRARTRDAVSPIQKVIQLLGDMQSKRIKEGEVEQGQFEQFSRWCERTAIEKQHTISDFKEQIKSLTATLDTANSNIEECSALIEDLSAAISSNEEQLKESTALRAKEHKDFLHQDADLGNTIDMLTRAHAVIKKHMSSPDAVLLQSSMQKALDGLRSIVDASFVDIRDRKVLMALLQQSSTDSEDDESLDMQPQAVTKASEAKSGPILDTIENMKEKAEVAREELQKAEMKTQHAFELIAYALKDETASLKKQLDEVKKKKNKNAEVKATATGQMEIAKKDLAGDEKYLADLQKECMEKADNFEVSQAERAAELKVLMMAKKILVNAGKAAGASFIQQDSDDNDDLTPMFLQTSSKTSTKTLSRLQQEWKTEAADYLIRQGDHLNSWVLSQVGSHISSDPFEKVKKMIQTMVDKLLEEQAAESEHKAWCDAELLKTTKAKKAKLSKVEELDTRIEKASALLDKLGEQVKALAAELSEMDKADKEATEMRQAENEEFLVKKADLDQALKATSSAIKVLRDYYAGKSFLQASDTVSMSSLMQEREQASMEEQSMASQPAGSAASSVIGLLEVAESDFTKALEEAQAAEDAAQSEYDAMMQDNKVSRAEKMADQKNKKAEMQRLENTIAETKLDHKDASDELNAILEYMDKLKGSCETKAPSFEERQKRRKEEMEGLQNALAILEGKAIALVETGSDGASFSDSAAASMLLRR